MGVYSIPRRDSFDPKPRSKQSGKIWDPIEILDIINPDRDCLTCVGYAPSRRRRCQNPINAGNRASAFRILDKMAYQDPQSKEIPTLLYELAERTLCLRYHQDQRRNMVNQWERKIAAITPIRKIKIEEPDYDDIEIMMELLAQLKADLKEEKKARAESQRERSQKEQRQEQRRESQRREKEEEEKKRQQRQREETERKARWAREQKEKEEKERKKQEAKEKREQDKKRQEEEEQQKKRREAKAWQDAWNTYVSQWNSLGKKKAQTSAENLREIIPWPVKSGKAADMTDAAVREFFRRGLPSANTPAENIQLMKKECLKWHEDRIPRLYGSGQMDDGMKKLFTLAVRVAIEVMQEMANKNRKA